MAKISANDATCWGFGPLDYTASGRDERNGILAVFAFRGFSYFRQSARRAHGDVPRHQREAAVPTGPSQCNCSNFRNAVYSQFHQAQKRRVSLLQIRIRGGGQQLLCLGVEFFIHVSCPALQDHRPNLSPCEADVHRYLLLNSKK